MMKPALLLTIALGLVTATSARAQDCFVDQKPDLRLNLFETTMGYRLSVARDGTVFKDTERTAFDLLSKLLPPIYRNMSTLVDLERVPDGYALEGGAVGEFRARRMIWNSVKQVRGHISLAEGTLTIANGRLKGEFYATVVHELTHALDYLYDHYSMSDEWIGLSQWNEEKSGTSTNFVSDYAKSHPEEDFAESLASFILDPDLLLKLAPTKYEMISKKFFNGQKFDTQSRQEYYLKKLEGLSTEERAAKIREFRKNDYYACSILPRP